MHRIHGIAPRNFARRSPGAWLLALLLLTLGIGRATAATELQIVADGKPRAEIVIADGASKQVTDAASLLKDYIARSTKATLPIRKEKELTPAEAGTTRIWIGPSDFVAALGLALQKMDGDGFHIHFPDEQNIVIIGPTDWGTEFGVYEFLERYAGVRWPMPGPDGEHVPHLTSLQVPMENIAQEPAFFSR